jgi:surface antigen
MPSYLSRQSGYVVLRRRLPTGACLLALALAVGGCSLSYQLDNIEDGSADQTGSVPVAAPPAEEDLAIARAAVNEVLTKGGKHTSLRWENPKTGPHGTVTPLALTYQQSGVTCRDFSHKLREERQRVVASGQGLPRSARQVGSAQFAPVDHTQLPTFVILSGAA